MTDKLLQEAVDQQAEDYEEVSEWRIKNSRAGSEPSIQYRVFDSDKWEYYSHALDRLPPFSSTLPKEENFRESDLKDMMQSFESGVKNGMLELQYSGSIESSLETEGEREVLYIPFEGEFEPLIVKEVFNEDGEFFAEGIKTQTDNIKDVLSEDLLIDAELTHVKTVEGRYSTFSEISKEDLLGLIGFIGIPVLYFIGLFNGVFKPIGDFILSGGSIITIIGFTVFGLLSFILFGLLLLGLDGFVRFTLRDLVEGIIKRGDERYERKFRF